jgi:outer membrane protein assembly factor BamB
MFTDNAIVFAGIDQGGVSDHDTVYAFDSKKGTPLWKVNIPNQHLNKHFLGLSLTATNKAVYVSQFNQDSPQVVEAFSISDGKSLWKASVSMKGGNHFDCLITCNLLSASTLVTNNILYLSPGTDSDAHVVVALNVSHGTYLWEDSKVNNFGPLQDRLYISHVNMSDFCQVDPITGRSQWCNSSKSYGNNPGERATSDQTTVYIPSLDGIHALQKNNGKLKWIYKGNTSGTALMVAYGLSFDY